MAIANGGLYDLCRPETDSQVMGEFAQNGIEKHFFLLSALPSVSIRSVKSLKHIMSEILPLPDKRRNLRVGEYMHEVEFMAGETVFLSSAMTMLS